MTKKDSNITVEPERVISILSQELSQAKVENAMLKVRNEDLEKTIANINNGSK